MNKPSNYRVKKERLFEDNIPKRTIPFIGGKSIFKELDDFLENDQLKICLIYNNSASSIERGVGKNTTLTEYCHSKVKKSDISIRWFDAETEDKFNQSLRSFSDSLGIKLNTKSTEKNPNILIKEITKKIFASNCKILFIITRLNDVLIAKEFLLKMEKLNLKLVILSRNFKGQLNELKLFFKPIEFNLELNQSDIKNYFKHFYKHRLKSTQELVSLTNLFLSKNQIKSGINPFLLHKFVSYLKFNYLYTFDEILNQQMKNIETFNLTFLLNSLKEFNQLSFELIQYSTVLNRDCIPFYFIMALFKITKNDLQVPLKILLDLNLVEMVLNNDKLFGLKLSDIVQKEAKNFMHMNPDLCLSDATIHFKVSNCLIELFPKIDRIVNEKWSKADTHYFDTLNFVQKVNIQDFERHEKDFLKHYATISYRLGAYNYFKNHDLDKSVKYTLKSLDVRRYLYKNDYHADLVKSANHLADCYYEINDFKKALKLYQEVYDLYKNVYIGDSLEIAQSLVNIGNCHLKIDEYINALYLFKEAFEMRSNLYAGKQNPELSECLNLIGVCYERNGEPYLAYTYHTKAYEMRLALFGNKHFDVAESLNNLGVCSYMLNSNKKAQSYFEEAYKMKLELGEKENCAEIADSLMNLAQVNLKIGDFKKALNLFEKTLKIRLSLKKANRDIEIAEILNSIGICLGKAEDYEESVLKFEKALNLRKKCLDKNHMDTVDTLINLSITHEKLGNKQKSTDYFNEAFQMRKALSSESLIKVISMVENWSSSLLKKWLVENEVKHYLIQCLEGYDGMKLVKLYFMAIDNQSYLFENVFKLYKGNSRGVSKEDCVNFLNLLERLFAKQLHYA